MGSKKQKDPPPPPAPAAIPTTAEADDAGNAEMLRRKRGSSYQKSFLSGPSLGGASQAAPAGGTSFLGG